MQSIAKIERRIENKILFSNISLYFNDGLLRTTLLFPFVMTIVVEKIKKDARIVNAESKADEIEECSIFEEWYRIYIDKIKTITGSQSMLNINRSGLTPNFFLLLIYILRNSNISSFLVL